MRSWKRLLLVMVGLSVITGCLSPLTAQSQEFTGGRKMLYLFSLDFPPDIPAQYPIPPIQETRFWRLLDREIQATDSLALTENMEMADYRVELRCSGVLNCSELAVDVKDAQRNVLTSFVIKHIAPFFGLGRPDLDKVSRRLAIQLDERIKRLDQGGYGFSE
jgi:hypothetical protein